MSASASVLVRRCRGIERPDEMDTYFSNGATPSAPEVYRRTVRVAGHLDGDVFYPETFAPHDRSAGTLAGQGWRHGAGLKIRPRVGSAA